jgi:predicted nucleic acid-binding protein
MACFIDTNILLYYFATDQADIQKKAIAEALLDRDDCILSAQVLQEFYVQATRPSRPDRISSDEAEQFVLAMLRFPIQPQTTELLRTAFDIRRRLNFSYWDSAIVAVAMLTDCDILYTEDLQHGQIINGIKVVNPFVG